MAVGGETNKDRNLVRRKVERSDSSHGRRDFGDDEVLFSASEIGRIGSNICSAPSQAAHQRQSPVSCPDWRPGSA